MLPEDGESAQPESGVGARGKTDTLASKVKAVRRSRFFCPAVLLLEVFQIIFMEFTMPFCPAVLQAEGTAELSSIESIMPRQTHQYVVHEQVDDQEARVRLDGEPGKLDKAVTAQETKLDVEADGAPLAMVMDGGVLHLSGFIWKPKSQRLLPLRTSLTL